MTDTNPTHRWHIFCRVVDNFGDIGVCWRLARQLVQVHEKQVTLWVDHLDTFQALYPLVDVTRATQTCNGVVIRHWCDLLPGDVTGADVVIEAFACELPQSYIAAMRQRRPTPPVWLNLEYLSAEAWVNAYHLGQSPVHGLTKTFFFPGFTTGTGGVLWDRFEPTDSLPPEPRASILGRLGITDPAPSGLLVSLFAYDNGALHALLQGLADYRTPITLTVPAGSLIHAVEQCLGTSVTIGRPCRTGNLTVAGLPFLPQAEYDQLLTLADLNFVRGEDSFVRTQVLARPFIWQIYPQELGVHLPKLDAFLGLFLTGADADLASTVGDAHRLWNGTGPAPVNTWSRLLDQLPAFRLHCQRWQQQLARPGDLASNLVHFCMDRV